RRRPQGRPAPLLRAPRPRRRPPGRRPAPRARRVARPPAGGTRRPPRRRARRALGAHARTLTTMSGCERPELLALRGARGVPGRVAPVRREGDRPPRGRG